MTPPRRTAVLLLVGSLALVAAAAALLLFTVPSLKLAAKEHWHRWSAPDVPEHRSKRIIGPDGIVSYKDPLMLGWHLTVGEPNLRYDFEDRSSTFFTEEDGRGVLLLEGTSQAIVRRVGDVSDGLVSISAGMLMKCPETEVAVRIIMRIDHADGPLVEWNEKHLRTDEHRPGEWERFDFEWLLRQVPVHADDLVSIFIRSSERVAIDEVNIVFRNATVLKPAKPDA